MAPATVYIVRHGETEENRLRVVQGQLDTQLNATGRAQARRVADALRAVPFDAAFSSDLARAAETAEIVLGEHPGVPLCRTALLRERYMGERQGRTLPAPPNPPATTTVESVESLAGRARAWWEECVCPLAAAAGPRAVLVVSHGGLIERLVRTLVGAGRVRCAEGVQAGGRLLNTSVTVVEVDAGGRGLLVKYGDVAHVARGVVLENADVHD